MLCDGVMVEEGIVGVTSPGPDIPPHGEGRLSLPVRIPEQGKAALLLSYHLTKEAAARQDILPADYCLGFDEIPLKTKENVNQTAQALLKTLQKRHSTVPVAVKEDDRDVILRGADWRYVYDKRTGTFSEMVYHNQNLLERPMEYNIWRAPTDNDRNIKKQWIRAGYDRTVSRAYATTVSIGNEDGKVLLETSLSVSAVYLQRILNIRAKWLILPDGGVDVHLDVTRMPEFPFLPRFGLRLFLPKSMEKVTYCGIGPNESYADKRQSGWHGRFEQTVQAFHEDYIRPQENGAHDDCDYVIVENSTLSLAAVKDGIRQGDSSGRETFSFQISEYTQEELTKKAHNYELEKSPYTVLCLDYAQSGIGSGSCGPELLNQYRLDEEHFVFELGMRVKEKF